MTNTSRILETALSPATTLDDILALAGSRYPVGFETVTLGEMSLEMLQITDLPSYIDRLVETARPGEKVALPFWAKIWPASFPLALLTSKLTPKNDASFLELGAGLGLCGLVAAKRGFKALITDIEPEALLFIRACILKNNLPGTARPAFLDIAIPGTLEQFDVIACSETLYLPELHAPLASFLAGHLGSGPNSQALLSCDSCREAAPFFAQAQQDFLIQRTQTTCRSQTGESQTCVLYRMRSRANA
jgi:predicted nicotinamide N-methyase